MTGVRVSKFIATALFLSLMPFRQLLTLVFPLAIFFIGKVKRKEIVTLFFIVSYTFVVLLLSRDKLVLNQLLSLFLFFPVIFFLVFKVSLVNALSERVWGRAVSLFCHVLLVNGFIGFAQYLINPWDDAAIGFYGRGGLQMHGLAILYFFSAIYFYTFSNIKYNKIKCILALFFMLTCFYGAGLLAVFFSISLGALVGAKEKLRAFFVFFLLVAFLIFLGFVIRPEAMLYNYNNLLLFFNSISSFFGGESYVAAGMPRKLVAWLNYFEALKRSPSSFIFGFGGGGFNSRAAFLLNGEYTSLSLVPYSASQWHDVFIKPLWSSYILSQQYQDGTMNQPFSSVLSVLSEYGVFAFLFVVYLFLKLRSFLLLYASSKARGSVRVLMINVMFFYFVFICLFDNIFEYAEIVVPFFVCVFALALITCTDGGKGGVQAQ